jgi:hypothetical protein
LAKSLKEKNRSLLWIAIAVNTLFFCAVVRANAIQIDNLSSIVSEPEKLVPVGLAVLISTVLNGFLSADTKARLVFLRWSNALPGHRAFTEYANADPRIDPGVLRRILGSAFPVDPIDQNRTWYRLYKRVEKEPAVEQVHRDFLLLRDYTGLSALFIVLNGGAGFCTISSLKVWALYLLVLAVQYVVVRQAASQAGVRMVTTVMARLGPKSFASTSQRERKTPKVAK